MLQDVVVTYILRCSLGRFNYLEGTSTWIVFIHLKPAFLMLWIVLKIK
jgi:hypothetical protein